MTARQPSFSMDLERSTRQQALGGAIAETGGSRKQLKASREVIVKPVCHAGQLLDSAFLWNVATRWPGIKGTQQYTHGGSAPAWASKEQGSGINEERQRTPANAG